MGGEVIKTSDDTDMVNDIYRCRGGVTCHRTLCPTLLCCSIDDKLNFIIYVPSSSFFLLYLSRDTDFIPPSFQAIYLFVWMKYYYCELLSEYCNSNHFNW